MNKLKKLWNYLWSSFWFVPSLMFLAREHKTIVRMEHGIGDFVVQNTPLASLAMESQPPIELVSALQDAYIMDRHRTVYQDPAFGVRQLVDMALRAISPGINDTTTAVMCIDYLTSILSRLASRDIPSVYCYEGKDLLVIGMGQTLESLMAESFDQIRASAKGNTAIMIRMLGALQIIASLTANQSRRQIVSGHVQWIEELAERTIESSHDKEKFENRLARLRKSLGVDNKKEQI
ncbi:MAG: hypothetical protein A2Y40_05875 [Candidatus Margulisbacteria bacterium GWF2_35_9]|nr:MAG: hypothetical protein A2Y40_05875 [Candidatus Margulisbacteria bacterium GWF2_35_9]